MGVSYRNTMNRKRGRSYTVSCFFIEINYYIPTGILG